MDYLDESSKLMEKAIHKIAESHSTSIENAVAEALSQGYEIVVNQVMLPFNRDGKIQFENHLILRKKIITTIKLKGV